MPAKAEKPTPNRLSASPVAYWLVLSQITSTPKMAASSAPAAMPAANPSQVLPVCTTGGKPCNGGAEHHALGAQVDDASFFIDQADPGPQMARTVPALSVAPIRSA